MCFVKLPCWENCFPHSSHLKGRSPVCILECCFKRDNCLNVFLQTEHSCFLLFLFFDPAEPTFSSISANSSLVSNSSNSTGSSLISCLKSSSLISTFITYERNRSVSKELSYKRHLR